MKYFKQDSIELFFDKEFSEFLSPEEILYLILLLERTEDIASKLDSDYVFFCETSAYKKLFDYYVNEMPYGVAKCRTGEPDEWILDRLAERFM
jgi:hypothetical protein